MFRLHFHIVMETSFFAHFCRTAYMKAEVGNCIWTSTKNRFKTEYFTRKDREIESLIMFSFWDVYLPWKIGTLDPLVWSKAWYCYLSGKILNILYDRHGPNPVFWFPKSVGTFTHTVASQNIVTEMWFPTFTILCFYTYNKDLCVEKILSMNDPLQIMEKIILKVQNKNICLQQNQWRLCVGYPQTLHDPSWHWQTHFL